MNAVAFVGSEDVLAATAEGHVLDFGFVPQNQARRRDMGKPHSDQTVVTGGGHESPVRTQGHPGNATGMGQRRHEQRAGGHIRDLGDIIIAARSQAGGRRR